jgi:hypothetical protein
MSRLLAARHFARSEIEAELRNSVRSIKQVASVGCQDGLLVFPKHADKRPFLSQYCRSMGPMCRENICKNTTPPSS